MSIIVSAARVDLALFDTVLDNDTVWGWVSDGTDDILSGIEVSQIQGASFLVIEFAEEPEWDAYAGLAWLSSNGWSWKENNDFKLRDTLIGDSILAFELSALLPDHTDFRFDEADHLKIYFRYGDWKDEENTLAISDLDVQAVYLTNERPLPGGEPTEYDFFESAGETPAPAEEPGIENETEIPIPQITDVIDNEADAIDNVTANFSINIIIGVFILVVIIILILFVMKKRA
jgi:hypothetical protein